MAEQSVRFHPPRVAASPALAWVLARAFGPISEPLVRGAGRGSPRPDSEACHTLARRLGLAPRIASRLGRERLCRELGEDGAEDFLRDRLRAAAGDLSWGVVARDLALAAAEGDQPVIFLKYLALRFAGVIAGDERTAADCDILLAPEAGWRFAERLEARGFTLAATRAMEHQLPPLYHPSGAPVEIHRTVLGVRPRGNRHSATSDDLMTAGLLERIDELPGPCFRPCRDLLAAHALVHGLAQHGWAPHAYPALRTVADLLDLGLGGEEGDEIAGRLLPWVVRAVSAGEVGATRDLCRRLAAGELSPLSEGPEDSGAGALLHHLLAGVLDREYRSSLRFPMLLRPLTDLPRPLGALLSVGRALVPGRTEMEILYREKGDAPPRGRRSRWWYRWWYGVRPFDLLVRAFRYARASLAVGRRNPPGE